MMDNADPVGGTITSSRGSARRAAVITACALGPLVIFSGCARGPARLAAPTLDASAVATALVARVDRDGDGAVSVAECVAVPSIGRVFSQYDADGDGRLTATEIADRIRRWQATRVARVSCSVAVAFEGRPLADAVVRLVPEPEFEGKVPAAEGRTDATGQVSPQAGGNAPGIAPGLYKVVIEHAKLAKSPQFNSETTLGLQIAPDDPGLMSLAFDLKPSRR